MSENLSKLAGRKGITDVLFDKMGKLAQKTGTLTREELDKLADEFLVGKANTYGSLTFYDFLKPENKGKKAYVCNGSACLCAGTQKNVLDTLQSHFKKEEIGHMTCLGRCHENSAFHMDGVNYSGSDILNIGHSRAEKKQPPSDKYIVGCHGTQVLTGDQYKFEECKEVFAKAISTSSEQVLEEITKSNIRGRGGAGFPMGFKLESCHNTKSDTRFIICNADEGDPGAYSDRYLLEHQPYAVLTGMLLAGYAAGADHGILYIRAEYPESVNTINRAISRMDEAGMTGSDINGSGFNFQFKIIKAQGAYICGEETALINSIEGQRPEIRVRPPYPTQWGLFGNPTVVNNVETLASLPYILDKGGKSYKELGT